MTAQHLTYRGAVYPWHCDHMGHMNVMWYVGKFDEATWNLFHQLGITSTYLRTHQRGMAAVDQHIEYKQELKAGDLVTVYTQILELHDKKIRFRHEMRSEDTGGLAAVTTLLAVHLDTQLRKSCAFSSELSQQMRDFSAAPDQQRQA